MFHLLTIYIVVFRLLQLKFGLLALLSFHPPLYHTSSTQYEYRVRYTQALCLSSMLHPLIVPPQGHQFFFIKHSILCSHDRNLRRDNSTKKKNS